MLATVATSHAFEAHTAEVQVRLEAPDLRGIFQEAARALFELMSDGPPEGSAGVSQELTVRAPDREALLVEWLDELIFHSETRKELYSEVEVLKLSDTELVARVRGHEPKQLKTAVKAATFHRLAIEEREGRFFATVVLDV